MNQGSVDQGVKLPRAALIKCGVDHRPSRPVAFADQTGSELTKDRGRISQCLTVDYIIASIPHKMRCVMRNPVFQVSKSDCTMARRLKFRIFGYCRCVGVFRFTNS